MKSKLEHKKFEAGDLYVPKKSCGGLATLMITRTVEQDNDVLFIMIFKGGQIKAGSCDVSTWSSCVNEYWICL